MSPGVYHTNILGQNKFIMNPHQIFLCKRDSKNGLICVLRLIELN